MIARGLRALITLISVIAVWQLTVTLTAVPHYILPGPLAVADALVRNARLIEGHALVTIGEIVAGLTLGIALGGTAALALAAFPGGQRWLMPVLVGSQAIPVYALAPLLVLWLGYGAISKIVMALLVIFFPVTAALFDGLRRTDPGWIDLARTMGASRLSILWRIRLPAALPAFASGVRVATAIAPIGAVIGEWVGASRGLGYLMLHANARMQTDLLFATLIVLTIFAVGLYSLVDTALRRLLPWQPDIQT